MTPAGDPPGGIEAALACWLNIYDEVPLVAPAGRRGGLAALTPVPAAAGGWWPAAVA